MIGRGRFSTGLLLSGVIATMAALVGQTASATRGNFAERRDQLAAMMPSERQQVLDAAADLEKLPPAEQQQLRRLQDAIETDPELRRTLGDYQNFLRSLSPFEREAQTQIQDPKERADQVSRLAAAQIANRAKSDNVSRSWEDRGLLTAANYESAIELLANELNLPPGEKMRLAALPDHRRHLELMEFAKTRFESRSRGAWPSEATVDQILEMIPDSSGRSFIERASSDLQRGMAMGVVVRNLVEEWQRLLAERVGEVQLQAALDDLSAREQMELAQLSNEEILRTAMLQSLQKQPGGDQQLGAGFRRVLELRDRFLPRLRERRPSWNRDDRSRFRGGPEPPPNDGGPRPSPNDTPSDQGADRSAEPGDRDEDRTPAVSEEMRAYPGDRIPLSGRPPFGPGPGRGPGSRRGALGGPMSE